VRSYEKNKIKATFRYNTHRAGKNGKRMSRVNFGWDDDLEKSQAYKIFDEASKDIRYWRFKISPDPKKENPEKTLDLRGLTRQMMLKLQELTGERIQFVGEVHNDHTDIPHIHAIVLLKSRLGEKEFHTLRQFAAQEALLQQQAQGHYREHPVSEWQRHYRRQEPAQHLDDASGEKVMITREPDVFVGTIRHPCPQCGPGQTMKWSPSGYWCQNCGHKQEKGMSLGL
jgi:hypothetical protein